MAGNVFDVMVLAALLYTAVLGSSFGTSMAACVAIEIYIAFSLAVLLHEPIAGFLTPLLANLSAFLPDWVPLPAWTLFFTFAALFWGTLIALWTHVHPLVVGTQPAAKLHLADRIGGALAGWLAGTLLVGGMLVTVSMLPVGFLKLPSRHMKLDVGQTALRGAGAFTGERHDGRSVVLYGEPPSEMDASQSQLASEWGHDSAGDGEVDDGDPYFDADNNGVFTEALYYLDLDSDGRRRVGLLEKYVVGRWDPMVASGDREVAETPPPEVVTAPTPAPKVVKKRDADRPLPPPPGQDTMQMPSLRSLPGAAPSGKVQKPSAPPPIDDF